MAKSESNEKGNETTMKRNEEGRILIVDDEADIARTLKLGLEHGGYRVEVHTDPVEALEEFKAGAFDLAIVDVRMDKLSGFDLYAEIRRLDPRLRVCFFTAYEAYVHEFHRMFPEVQADCFMMKPMSIAEFVSSVDRLLGE